MTETSTEYFPQLMSRLLSALQASAAGGLAEMGLSIPAARALVALLHNGPMRVSRLADLVGLDPTALSHLMRSMEQRDLLSRERHADDHRAVIASLTEHGSLQAQRCGELYERAETMLLRDLRPADVTRLRGLLEHMLQNASASGRANGEGERE
jgi:DNA-binding MarR family transcriptional regulator